MIITFTAGSVTKSPPRKLVGDDFPTPIRACTKVTQVTFSPSTVKLKSRQFVVILILLCWEAGSNCRPFALQANALPTELSQHIYIFITYSLHTRFDISTNLCRLLASKRHLRSQASRATTAYLQLTFINQSLDSIIKISSTKELSYGVVVVPAIGVSTGVLVAVSTGATTDVSADFFKKLKN